MDEASRLVSELQQKLSELDHKVWQYRRDMASEFTKYAENVLRNVPKDVSDTVSKAIAESFKDYKSLNLDGLSSIESCATGSNSLANGIENAATSFLTNPTRTMAAQSHDQEVDRPRSPHEREKEFQGVFTPSYLPLLDSTTRNERRSSYDPHPSPSPSLDTKGKGREMEASHADAGTETTRSLAPSPELRRPQTPKRKNTDEWSVASDVSDGPVRRSALRRSSSTSRGSPRRVRFDVAGEEVLPTASPQPGQSMVSEDILSTSFDSDDEAGSEQVEDIDDVPPKRISSSQALRALSRGPFEDDGTEWTTVSAPPDGSASVPAVSGITRADSEEDLYFSTKKPSAGFDTPSKPFAISEKAEPDASAATTSNTTGDSTQDDETPTDDDEMLDMPPLKSMKGKSAATALPTSGSPIIDTDKLATTATRSPSKPLFAIDDFISKQAEMGEEFRFLDEEEDMYHIDENNETNDQRSPPEDENIDTDSDSPVSPVDERPTTGIATLSRSPAREIPKPTGSKHSNAPDPKISKGVVGSYKGRPFSMPVVVNDEILAQAASMGAVNSFVGSLDGRSGLDESDVLSFRASGGIGSFSGFSGTPKSLSERMMMDEMREAEKAHQSKQHDTKGHGR
jgi:hypothetical protein